MSHGEQDNNQVSRFPAFQSPNSTIPDLDAFEERAAAIAEDDGWLTRNEAEDLAAKCQGYDNVVDLRAAQKKNHKAKPKSQT